MDFSTLASATASKPMQTRREFLKDSCAACLSTAFLGLTFSQLTSCSSLPIYKTDLSQKKVTVPLTSFAESKLVIVRDLQVQYDVLLVKQSEQEYTALYMRCSHQENAVTATANGLFCSAHGSAYDLQGNVTKAPAIKPLQKFNTELNTDSITIHITI
jgi:Rieske Fe-S protein